MSDRLLRLMASRRARRTALLAILWTAMAVFLVAIREVLLPFFVAIFLAYVIDPIVRRIGDVKVRGRSLPRWAAVISLYLALFAVAWAFVVFFVPRLYTEVARLASTTGAVIQRVDQESIQDAADRMNAFLERTRLPLRVSAEGTEPATLLSPPTLGGSPATPVVESPPIYAVDAGPAGNDGGPVSVEPRPAPDEPYRLAGPDPTRRPSIPGPSLTRAPTRPDADTRPPDPSALALSDDVPTDSVLYVVPLGDLAKSAVQSTVEALQARTGSIAVQLQHVVGGALNFIFKFFLVLMLTAFLASDKERVTRFAFSVVPMEDRARFDDLLSRIDTGLSGVVRGQITICLVNGALTLVGLLLFDVKFAFILATVAAIFSLVPIFGSIASTIPIVAVSLATAGFGTAVLMLVWIVGIHALEANLLNPKIMGDAARIHPFLVVLALIAGEHFYGIAGALFAVPILSIGLTLFKALHARALALESPSTDAVVARSGAPPQAPKRKLRIRREPRH